MTSRLTTHTKLPQNSTDNLPFIPCSFLILFALLSVPSQQGPYDTNDGGQEINSDRYRVAAHFRTSFQPSLHDTLPPSGGYYLHFFQPLGATCYFVSFVTTFV